MRILEGLFLGFLWLWGTVFIVSLESKVPATDVFLFKEAGTNFAKSGQFAVSNLPHMPVDEVLPYAYYPPVYPFLFGVWSKVLGVSLKSSILFDSFIRLFRTWMLFLLMAPWVHEVIKRNFRSRWLLAGFLLALCFVSSDGDRPDDLALAFGLASWVLTRVRTPLRTLFGGVLLGLCGATSPAAGVLFALSFVIHSFFHRRFAFLFGVGTLAALSFGLCNYPIYLQDPLAWERFNQQATLSNFPYLAPWGENRGWEVFFLTFTSALTRSWAAGAPYLLACICLIGLGGLWFRRMDGDFLAEGRSLQFSAFGFSILCMSVWTLQPYYCWFVILLLSAVLFACILRSAMPERRKGLAVLSIVLSFSGIFMRESKAVLHAWQRPVSQSSLPVAARVLSRIDSQERLAVTSDQYFTFRPFRKVENVGYVCGRLHLYDYVYVTAKTTNRLRAQPTPMPCARHKSCFTVDRDFSEPKVFTILGIKTPYYVRTHAGVLYRNTQCPTHLAKTSSNL